MNPQFSYTLKVWVTTLAIMFVSIETMIFYGLAQPNHSKEWLDPFFGALVCLILTLVFLPSFIVFIFLVKPISTRFVNTLKVKITLSVAAGLLISITVVLLLIYTYPGTTYLWIGLFYFACMLVGLWVFKLPQLESQAIDITDKE